MNIASYKAIIASFNRGDSPQKLNYHRVHFHGKMSGTHLESMSKMVKVGKSCLWGKNDFDLL